MSIKLMSEVWDIPELKGAIKLVLLALADHANEQGMCWPSMPHIAYRSSVSERHATRVVNWLVDNGYVAVIQEANGRGKKATYQVTPSNGSYPEKDDMVSNGKTLFGSKKDDMVSQEKDDTVSQKDDICAQKGDICGIAYIEEPPIESPIESPGRERALPAPSPSLPDVDFMDNQSPPASATSSPLTPPPEPPKSKRFDGRKFVNGKMPAKAGSTPAEVFYEVHTSKDDRCILSDVQLDAMTELVTDLALWREVVRTWALRGNKPTNIEGQIDWYRDPSRFRKDHHGSHTGPRNGNGGAPTGRAPTGPPVAPFTKADILARQARLAQLPEDERPPF